MTCRSLDFLDTPTRSFVVDGFRGGIDFEV
jgi:hypothetical protein